MVSARNGIASASGAARIAVSVVLERGDVGLPKVWVVWVTLPLLSYWYCVSTSRSQWGSAFSERPWSHEPGGHLPRGSVICVWICTAERLV